MTITRFQTMMRFWSVCFAVVGVIFVVAPSVTIGFVNGIAETIGFTSFIPESTEFFWLALTGSMMMTIAYLSWQSARYPEVKSTTMAVLLSKFVSTVLFIIMALRTDIGAYIIGAVVDGSILLIIAFSYRRIQFAEES